MAKKTTVDLTDKAVQIKEALMPIFGLRNILSAGLLMLNKLSSNDLQTIIAEANDKPITLDLYKDRDILLDIRKIVDDMVSSWGQGSFNVLDETVNELNRTVGHVETPIPSSWRVDFCEDYGNTQKKLDQSLAEFKKVVFSTKIELLSDEDAEIVRNIRLAYGPDADKSAADAISDDRDADTVSRAGPSGTQGHNGSKAG